jgi:hypothetical protein
MRIGSDSSLITELKKLEGSISYDSDYCEQVIFLLANGKTLRICGPADEEGYRCDQFEGLFNEFK